jgi:general secretion pathway protein M
VSPSALSARTALAALQPWRALARERWQALAPRERRGLLLVALGLGVLVGWLLLIQPAWRTVRDAPAELDQLDVQLQQLQALAAESRSLAGVTPVAPAQAAVALKSATDRLGERARLAVQGDRATLTLTGVHGDALKAWLTEARSGARARTLEAQLSRSTQGFSGKLVVAIPTGSAP